jgi:hypothetical protein
MVAHKPGNLLFVKFGEPENWRISISKTKIWIKQDRLKQACSEN